MWRFNDGDVVWWEDGSCDFGDGGIDVGGDFGVGLSLMEFSTTDNRFRCKCCKLRVD